MKCFNHHDRDAFGVCRICGKALCLECMQQNSSHVLCANKDCIERDALFEKYYQNTNVIYSAKSIAKIKMLGVVLLIFGALLSMIGLLGTKFDAFMFGMGIFIIILGVANIRRSNEFVAVEDKNDNSKVKRNFNKYLWIIIAICVIAFLLSIFLVPAQ